MILPDPVISERQKPDPAIEYSFEELRQLCQETYPEYVTQNVDTLYRGWWDTSDIEGSYGVRSVKNVLSAQSVIERSFLRHAFGGGSRPRPQLEYEKTLLVPFVPFRSDYQPLIYPVTNNIAENDVNVVVLVSEQDYESNVSHRDFQNTTFWIVDDYFTVRNYLVATKRFSQLKPTIKRLCDQLDLSVHQRHNTYKFYKRYCKDWTVFAHVLEDIQPDLLYNIHYLNHPGYVRGLAEYDQSDEIPNIIIQHGINSGHPFGIFRNADVDISIFWGEYFERKLETYLVPTPPTKQIGNPKLERILSDVSISEPGEGVLYLPTKLNCEGATQSLRRFAEIAADQGWQVTYKPHPRNDAETITEIDYINPDQVVMDRSMYEMIADAKVVVGFRSTGVIEAVALDKVTLQFRPSKAPEDWTKQGLLGGHTESEISAEITKLIEDDEYYESCLQSQKDVRDLLFGDLNTASDRIADLLYELITDVK